MLAKHTLIRGMLVGSHSALAGDRGIFRLHIVEGPTLDQFADQSDHHRERIHQPLARCFGQTGLPPTTRRSVQRPD